MRAFICVMALALSFFVTELRADHTIPGAPTFCSMAARSGHWAFSFSDTTIDLNCRRAAQAIYWVTPAPIHRQNFGYYSPFGWNEVTASCYPFTTIFTGRGVEPLQRAYNSLKFTAQDCVFFIRY